MKFLIVTIGKERDESSKSLIHEYELRLLRYMPIEWVYIPHAGKREEGEKILSLVKKEDYIVLLDEKGKEMNNMMLSELVENRMVDGIKRLVFVIGGAYGVSPEVHKRANYTWKLSSLVFPHRLVRIILLEQLYRTMTILRGEQYHHE